MGFASMSFMKKMIFIAVVVVTALLLTISFMVHSKQVGVQEEKGKTSSYQVYDLEQLRLKERDPEYRAAATRIGDKECCYLLSPCEPIFSFRWPLFGWPTESWKADQAKQKEKEQDPSVLWPSFEVGNWVSLCAESERTYKYRSMASFGPFQIIERVTVGNGTTGKYNYKLAIPSELNYLHPVFHGSMLVEENIERKKWGLGENTGAHRRVWLPNDRHSTGDGCRIFRPEEINNNTARATDKDLGGDSLMSIISSILQKYIYGNVRNAVKLILGI